MKTIHIRQSGSSAIGRLLFLILLVMLLWVPLAAPISTWAEAPPEVQTGETPLDSEENLTPDVIYEPIMEEDDFIIHSEKGKVLNVIEREAELDEQFITEQTVMLEITSGKYRGQVVEVLNILSGNYIYEIPVETGDKVMVHIEEYPDTGEIQVYISDFARDTYIYMLGGLFLLALMAIGRMQGVKTVLTLGFTMVMIYKVLLPALLAGYSPIALTVLVAIVINVVTYLVISGVRRKSFAAMLGATIGVIIAGLLAYVVGSQVRLTGLSGEEAGMLLYIPQGTVFNFRELMFAGILLGALGAVMDVAMSIASAIDEVHRANPLLKSRELFAAGMTVGKDIMGTMSNTLILAYTGSSIPLLLIFLAYDTPLNRVINLDLIATEIVRSLAGTIGLVLTIPITAVIAVALKGKK
jgi:uncharacterized membrane protein